MPGLFSRQDLPDHLFNVTELDLSRDLLADPLGDPWFRLGARTIKDRRDEKNVEEWIERQCFLVDPEGFAAVFEELDAVGNIIHNLGVPGGSSTWRGETMDYNYSAFYRFEFTGSRISAEPLVFGRSETAGRRLLVNPDLWLFLGLKETSGGIWRDPRRGVDGLRHKVNDGSNLEAIEVRTEYLINYLRARQMSLVVGHFRQLLLFNPPPSSVELFVKDDITLGSSEMSVKAVLENWGLRKELPGEPFLQRRLHLWYEIKPREIDTADPWLEEPSFDAYTFTFPTRTGPVAPARWKRFKPIEGREFEGDESFNFMDRVFFRQEVLCKYEGASGFSVKDNGSVRCHDFWALDRSTARLGNELLSTAIGDFAEGVPFEEWPHWQKYAVEPPSLAAVEALREEMTVPQAVNFLVSSLEGLNEAFSDIAKSLGVTTKAALWGGSLDSPAGRQLKWVYPTAADDDEFLKRAMLTSTLVLDGLNSSILRAVLKSVGDGMHQTLEEPPQAMGSRKLLQRTTLIAAIVVELHLDRSEAPALVRCAEGKEEGSVAAELRAELEAIHKRVAEIFSSLAFLYDLRQYGGLAHPPSREKAAATALKLGLSEGNWGRSDYLFLLGKLADDILLIRDQLEVVPQQ